MATATRGLVLLVLAVMLASPALAQEQKPAESITERVGEIRVHGNASTSDADVLRIAGVALGDALEAGAVAAIEERLKKSGRFATVEVRKRYRSIDGGDVALILVVHEHPGATTASPMPGPLRRIRHGMMYMPILNFDEGYGFTYGVRSSAVNVLRAHERLSIPLTWGGVRRVALEGERTFKSGPLTRIVSSVGLSQREHPRYEVDDRRVELQARAERVMGGRLRLGGEIGRTGVTFGGVDDRFWSYGGDVTLDTRDDPQFPGDAIVASAGWTTMRVQQAPSDIIIGRADVRGFKRLIGQSVLAVRASYKGANRPLPQYERLMLGGGSTVRGYRVGAFDGDRVVASSLELRVPITSPFSAGKMGLSFFVDAGAAYEAAERLRSARFHRGGGAGVFLLTPLFRVNVDVARNAEGGGRVHVSAGFTF